MIKLLRKVNNLEKKLREPGTYIEKLKKRDREYKELIYNLTEHGKVTITEIERMSLQQRIEYQEFIVNKLKAQKSGRNKGNA